MTNDVKNWKTELKRKFLSFPKATGLLLSVSKKVRSSRNASALLSTLGALIYELNLERAGLFLYRG